MHDGMQYDPSKVNIKVTALDRKFALYVSVDVVDRCSGVHELQKCDIKMSGDGQCSVKPEVRTGSLSK